MSIRILTGDCRDVLKTLPDQSVHCCVTSPPYFGLRDYGVAGQVGLEATPGSFVAEMVAVFREVRRVLRDDGTLWLNFGDSYSGSGKGGNPIDSPHQKQRSNAGSMTVVGNTAREAAKTKFAGEDRCFGLKPKDLIGIPWMVAFALRSDGWFLRQDIIWSKPNPMPESVTDRCTKAHEYIFLLSKSGHYFYDAKAIAEPSTGWHGSEFDTGKTGEHQLGRAQPARKRKDRFGGNKHNAETTKHSDGSVYETGETRNKRSVWNVATQSFSEAHFATFPTALIEPCILAGCPTGGTVLDPFGGAGTTGLVADRLQRSAVLIELNPSYALMARNRITNDAPLFAAE